MADEPLFISDEDWTALIVLVDADHRDHGIPDRSVPHDCGDFHYPCPADGPLIWRAIYDGVVEPWFHRDTLSVELVTPEEAARRREGE